MVRTRRRRAVLAAALLAVMGSLVALSPPAAAGRSHWVTAWAAAAQPSTEGPGGERTLRFLLRPSIAGRTERLHLSNAFGSRSVDIAAATVGLSRGGPRLSAGHVERVTFQGQDHAVLSRGGDVLSDPVSLPYGAGQNLAVSLYLRGATGEPTGHAVGLTTAYATPRGSGDDVLDARGSRFRALGTSYFLLDRLDVLTSASTTAVVTFGDSITDGAESRLDADHRYPDYLAGRLQAAYGLDSLAVANEGISGNALTLANIGVAGLDRLGRDALDLPGVRTVILLEGINDINLGRNATQITAGYLTFIARAHARGIRVIGGTLTPPTGYAARTMWSPSASSIRAEVNQWIRTSRAFDDVVDFDAAVGDPGPSVPLDGGSAATPEVLNPAYDSGDHVHPNDAGYQAMAGAVNIAELERWA